MDKMILGLHHIAIFVKDLEVSRKFYCEKLGFEVTNETTLEVEGGIAKIIFIAAGTCIAEVVELPKYTQREDGGYDHLAFKVKDVEHSIKDLKAKGITFETEEPFHVPEFCGTGGKWIFFRGPDNERLEIYEDL